MIPLALGLFSIKTCLFLFFRGKFILAVIFATLANDLMKKGHIFFISGPSGVGKGTVIERLKQRHPDWIFPPSCTTRAPRPGELEGETYYFISAENFKARLAAGEFLEHAQVHAQHFYGVLKAPLLEGVEQGKIVIREFDVQGFAQAKTKLPREIFTSFFLLPAEGLASLIQRIQDRAPISPEELLHREESMSKELAAADQYDHQLSSYDGKIEELVQQVEAVILQQQGAV